MKKIVFPRLIKWMFLTALAFLIFMTAMRFVFYFHYKPLEYSFSNSFKAFLLGLNFDTRIVCGIVLFPFLIGNLYLHFNEKKRLSVASIFRLLVTVIVMTLLIIFMKKGHMPVSSLLYMGILFALILVWLWVTKNCNPFENNFSRKVFKIYFLLITIVLVFLYAVDFQHYDYLHQRLNAGVMNYAGDAKISLNMVWETYPVFTIGILIVISTIVLYGLITWWFRKTRPSLYQGSSLAKIFVSIVFTLVLGTGIFGRINQYPLRWSDAFSFDDDFKANLALNPIQSFLSTLQFRNSSFDLKKVKAYYPLMAQYLDIKDPDSAHLNYKRIHEVAVPAHQPNVVVVICESFSAYKSSMYGNPLNTTPYFNEMCRQGIFFDRCFTPAYGTARGVWGTITGIPDVEYPNTSSRNPGYVDQHSLINDYKGYEKFYFIGGSSSWANIRGLLTNNLTGLHLFEEENYKSQTIDVWGISDKRLFLEANKVLKDQKKPFFAVIQTADNHRPYTIPKEDTHEFSLKKYDTDSLRKYGFYSNEELNAFRYTDFSFQKFIEAAKKEAYFNNTIFVFVGDHGIRGDAGDMFPKAWEASGLTTQHVPLLFYAPSLLSPQRINKTCSQLDLLPSVSALAKIPFVNTTLGKNLFDTAQTPVRFQNSAFLFDPNIKQIGMVTDEYAYTHNLISGKENFRSSKDNLPIPRTTAAQEDKKILQSLADAYYETAKYMLYHNKKAAAHP
ncbi:MAG: sulfatase-like hydrolase/transferase [Ginsengibacter sp.]